jgi:hypothetical protein
MIDTIATRTSEASARHDAAVAAPGFRMRWWMVGLILMLSLSSGLGGALCSYLRFEWFESDVLDRPAGLYGGEIHGPIFRRFLQDTRVKRVFRSLQTKR